jgi:hypothetical protein
MHSHMRIVPYVCAVWEHFAAGGAVLPSPTPPLPELVLPPLLDEGPPLPPLLPLAFPELLPPEALAGGVAPVPVPPGAASPKQPVITATAAIHPSDHLAMLAMRRRIAAFMPRIRHHKTSALCGIPRRRCRSPFATHRDTKDAKADQCAIEGARTVVRKHDLPKACGEAQNRRF